MNKYDSLTKNLGYTFINDELLVKALTHISYANDYQTESYERLEFLGDAILELVVSDYIYNQLDLDAGQSTKLRAYLVSTNNLYDISTKLQLDRYALISKSLSILGHKNIADLFESVVGAIYLDGGLKEAEKFISKFVIIDENNINRALEYSVDYKTKLQEILQKQAKKYEYKLTKAYGMDHDKTFRVELLIENESVAVSEAKNIQQAQEQCAKMYLEK